MKLKDFAGKLSEVLRLEDYEDLSLNGLQVGDADKNVKKAAFSVDACQASVDAAVSEGADVLVVHHGLFWGKPIAVTGNHYNRVKTMLDNNLALFACHLPLDAHPVLGNNAQMAQVLGLDDVSEFCMYHGKNIGFKGILSNELTTDEIISRLGIRKDNTNVIINGGKALNKTVGIVSGSAASDVFQAMEENLDVFITGESSHAVYHDCMERKINMLCLGHYETEVFGIKALMSYVERVMNIETVFIDIPTHI